MVMYLSVRGIDFASFCNCSGLWNYGDSIAYFVFHVMPWNNMHGGRSTILYNGYTDDMQSALHHDMPREKYHIKQIMIRKFK